MSLAVCKMQSRLSPCHYQLQIRANFFGCQDFLFHLVTSCRLCLHSSRQGGDVLLLLTFLAPTRPFYLSRFCILSWFRSRPAHLHCHGIVCSNSLLHVRDKSTRESVVVFLLLLLSVVVVVVVVVCCCAPVVRASHLLCLSIHQQGTYTRLQQQQLLHYEMMK